MKCPACGWGDKKTKARRPAKNPFLTQPLDSAISGDKVILIYPLPLSKNAEPKHWAAIRELRAHWAHLSEILLCRLAPRPNFDRVELEIYLYPKRKGRDIDNFLGHCWKGLQDGLVRGGLIKDDSSKYLTIKSITLKDYDGHDERLAVIVKGYCNE